MDRKIRREIKKAYMIAAESQLAAAEATEMAEKAKMDLETSKGAISQLEARTEVLEKGPLPLPTPSA